MTVTLLVCSPFCTIINLSEYLALCGLVYLLYLWGEEITAQTFYSQLHEITIIILSSRPQMTRLNHDNSYY